MFEQTLIEAATTNRKSYSVLLSLLLQSAALAALIGVPFIYTQVLPKAQLRNIFAAPTPPAAAPPKAPASVRMAASPSVFRLRTTVLPAITAKPRAEMPDMAAPPLLEANQPGDSYGIGDPVSGGASKPPEPPAQPLAKLAHKPVRIASMEASQLIYRVQPAYPQLARATRIQGIVEFTATISKSGNIEHLQLLHGHPMLVKAAEEAILQWKYKPTLLNGEPVEVITDIIVNFTLTQ